MYIHQLAGARKMTVEAAVRMIGWFADHWFQLIMVLGVFIIIVRLRFICETIYIVQGAATENAIVSSRLASEATRVSDNLNKIQDRINSASFAVAENIEAIAREVRIISEVVEHGREWRNRRILQDIERWRPARERRFAEMREKAENGDVQAQGDYARYCAALKEYAEAYVWYTIAITQAPHWQHGVRQRQEIARNMTSEQLGEAEGKARGWLDSYQAASNQNELGGWDPLTYTNQVRLLR